mmetsp:Transcript_32514/g.66225  ORF Transcript_32514/g.66225 Transcript_32514/m.66225 type:complete len:118 (-) Transcript_32514:412-765(-)
MDVDDPREKVRSLGNSTLMVVGCCCCCVCDDDDVSPMTRKSRGGGDEGGVSLKEGEPESMLILVLEVRALDGLEVRRFHDPLMLDMDPLMFYVCTLRFLSPCLLKTMPLVQSLKVVV